MRQEWQVKVRPKALAENVIQGEKYRITMLTQGLIRLEYSEDGCFEDRATQSVWNRDFSKTEFRCKGTPDSLEIFTSRIHLVYDKQKFSPNGLSVQVLGQYINHGSIWHYGQDFQNLGGTARTLDEADGAIPLEKGIMGRVGFSLLDDSKSLVLTEDGWIEPRKSKGEDLYFWGYGHDYLEALKDFYYLCGKLPMVPRYALGNWWSRYYKYTEKSYMELMERFEKENLPFSVAVIDMDWHLVDIDPKYGSGWTGYTWNREFFPDPDRFLKWLHDRNMHVTLNIHPADGVRAYEEVYEDMAKTMGVDYENEEPVNFDAADPKYMEASFDHIFHPMEEKGVDFWWIDWQQGGVTKVEGLDPLWVLNHYHYLDNARDGKRPMTFSRYAGPGSHRYPIGFSGDTLITWESLNFQPYFTSTASNIGYAMWSHDIGRHMQGIKDDEMAGRWLQYGVFTPIMRLHSSCGEFNGKEPWRYKTEIRLVMEEFLRLRHKLIPYLYTMNYRTYQEDIPLVLPMYYHNPEREEAYQVPNEYEFGSQLLVVPVTSKRIDRLNVAKVKVWLPEGTYYDIFTGRKYKGNRIMMMYRDIQSIPVLAKAGAVIPMTEEIREAGANPGQLTIQVYAGADGEFVLYEDDNNTEDYKDGKCVKTRMQVSWGESSRLVIEKPEGCLEYLPEKRTYTVKFHGVCDSSVRAEADGASCLTQCSYDEKTNTLTCQVETLPSDTRIQVVLEQAVQAENHVTEECFDFLNQAEIPFPLKEVLYQTIKDQEDKTVLLSTLQAMELDRELLGALTEIITA